MAERLLALERASQSAYKFRSRLDGTAYGFRLAWNTRAEHWTAAISAADGTELLTGRVLRAGENILEQHVDARLPPGTLEVVDTSGAGGDPGRFDLGARVRLVYTPIAEV